MTTNANAPVETRHINAAWNLLAKSPATAASDELAQTLANLEAARAENADLTNRLGEIDTSTDWYSGPQIEEIERQEIDRAAQAIANATGPAKDEWGRAGNEAKERYRKLARAALASGHTPSPCPSCAAKDEAVAEREREVSVACALVVRWFGNYSLGNGETIKTALSRFIIPPADPVAEALKAAFAKLSWDGSADDCDKLTGWPAALAELKSRLPLGGA